MAGNTNVKNPPFQITRKALCGILLCFFAALGAMFTLGVYVGRGMAPVRFDIQKLEQELADLKEAAMRREEKSTKEQVDRLVTETNFAFPEALKRRSGDLHYHPTASGSQADKTPGREAAEKQPATTKVAPAAGPSDTRSEARDPSWTIQVAALAEAKDAAELVDKLKKMGYSAYVSVYRPQGKPPVYRVRVGTYKDMDAARETRSKLLRSHPSGIIVRN